MLYYHHMNFSSSHKKTKQNPHILIFWGICPEMLNSRKGDGEQEQSVSWRHEHPPSKKCCWLPPWPFSQEVGTICFYKAHLLPAVPYAKWHPVWRWLVESLLRSQHFLTPIFRINDFHRRAFEFPFLLRQSQTRLTWLSCCCLKHSFPSWQFFTSHHEQTPAGGFEISKTKGFQVTSKNEGLRSSVRISASAVSLAPSLCKEH